MKQRRGYMYDFYLRRYCEKSLDKIAHEEVTKAIKRGELVRGDCEGCGRKQARFGQAMHAHHEDYRKPLEVIWLCASCHVTRHKELSRMGRGPMELLRQEFGPQYGMWGRVEGRAGYPGYEDESISEKRFRQLRIAFP